MYVLESLKDPAIFFKQARLIDYLQGQIDVLQRDRGASEESIH
jgi:hypothetical protein